MTVFGAYDHTIAYVFFFDDDDEFPFYVRHSCIEYVADSRKNTYLIGEDEQIYIYIYIY